VNDITPGPCSGCGQEEIESDYDMKNSYPVPGISPAAGADRYLTGGDET
jgi:hypothetical protein